MMNTAPCAARRAGGFCLWGLCAALLSACAGAGPDYIGYDPDEFYTGPTAIEEVSLSCAADGDEWTLTIGTVGWTAGGLFAWSPDGYYLEEHDIVSDEADFYGAWDLLVAELSIAADPRDVSKGSSTALLCDTPTREGLRGWLVIYDPETEEEIDCRTWGAAMDWEAEGYSPCSESITLEF
jgi:hypothetical protein